MLAISFGTILLLVQAVPSTAQDGAPGSVAGPSARSAQYPRFQGPERAAIERCAPRLERFGRLQVEDVRRHGRSGWRVRGTVNDGGAGLGYGYGLRRGYGHRTFTCTVGEDGQVRLKTQRLRRY